MSDSAGTRSYVTVEVGGQIFGIAIERVREVFLPDRLTHVPLAPPDVAGVLNLRGAIVPIVDLRCRFGEGLTETTSLHIVIIVQIGDRQVGLIGDRVLDIVAVTPAQIQPVPQTGHGHSTNFLAGLVSNEDVMIALIDLPHLLADAGSVTLNS